MPQLQILDEKEIENIYHKHLVYDFPPSETKPLKAIIKMLEEGHYFCYGLYENDTLLSYAFFVSVPATAALPDSSVQSYLLLDYFAVVSDIRGTGIGSKTLSFLRNALPSQSVILIEAENPQKAADSTELQVRESRLRFYLHNACRLSSVTATVYGVDYCIFSLYDGEILEDSYVKEILETIYNYMFTSHDVWQTGY